MIGWSDAALLAAAAACILGAATLRGLTGFGFAVAAVPLLSLFVAPVRAVPLVICLQGLAGAIDLRGAWRHCDRPSIAWLSLGALIGSPFGVYALSVVSAPAARLAIAAISAAAVATLAFGLSLRTLPRAPVTLAVGTLSGLCNGLAAMPGPPVVAYYMAAPMARARMRASFIVFFFGTAVIAAASAGFFGLIDRQTVLVSLLALPLMHAGTRLGHRLFLVGSEAMHRSLCLALLALGAAAAGIRGLADLL